MDKFFEEEIKEEVEEVQKPNVKYDKEIVNIFRNDIIEFGWEHMKRSVEEIKNAVFRYEMRLHLYKANEGIK